MVRAAVCSKVVILLLLLVHCFMYLPLFVGVLCWSFLVCISLCPFLFSIVLTMKRELDVFFKCL